MPPWISFELRLLVPAAKSIASTSPVRSPRNAASRAIPAPVIPPPTTSRSSSSAASARRAEARVAGESAVATGCPGSVGGAELREHCLRLGDLVGPSEIVCRLERAARVGDALVAVPAPFAHPRETQSRGYGVGIERDHAMEHRLAT